MLIPLTFGFQRTRRVRYYEELLRTGKLAAASIKELVVKRAGELMKDAGENVQYYC